MLPGMLFASPLEVSALVQSLPLFLPLHPPVSCVLGFTGPPPALRLRPSLQAVPGAAVWGGGSYCSCYLQRNVPYDCIK